ncbi:MAG TPA: AIR synthase related protein, partial [Bryobacteraceae bacterium]|nr:AIR synthase related protein [Bryobacteraceae bacterium]
VPVQPKRIPDSPDLNRDLETLLSSPDLCSKHWIWEQYDYMVRTNTVAGPGFDAAIIRIKETGTSVAMSLDGNGRYCYLDPREGTKLVVAECCRNLSAVGALPVATTNNLNFGNPERPEIMAQLVESIEGMAEACTFFDVPVTGGNVSLYNETLGEAIFPTPVVGIVGLMNTALPVGTGFPRPGVRVVMIGGNGSCDDVRFGSSQYVKHVLGGLWGLPPVLDMDFEKRVQKVIREVIAAGLALSSHDLGDGGLAVALAESSFPHGVGADLELDSELRPEFLLFGESPSRILVSTEDVTRIQLIAAQYWVPVLVLGVTIADRLRVRNRQTPLMDCDIQSLRAKWASSLEGRIRR